MNSPVDYSTRGFGDFGAVPNAAADFCYGPETFAVPDWPLQYFTRWVAWKAADGVRILKNPPTPFNPGPTDGDLSGLFDGDTDFDQLSFGFDQNGRAVIAVNRPDSGEVELRRFQAGEPTAFTWTGKSPRVFYNGELEYVVGDTDVVCWYLPAAGDQLLVRVQRDNYGVEYVMNPELNLALTRLTKVDRVGTRAVIWGIAEGAGRSSTNQSVLLSQVHNPWPVLAFEQGSQRSTLLDGEYLSAIALAPAQAEFSNQSAALLDGEYLFVIVPASEGDGSLQNSTLLDGEYSLVVITAPDQNDASTQSATLLDGEYVQTVVNGPDTMESASQNSTLLDGSYEEA